MNVDFNTATTSLAHLQGALLAGKDNLQHDTTYASMEVSRPPVKKTGPATSSQKEPPFKISISKKLKGQKCCAYGCNNDPVSKKGGLCHKHYARKRRAIAPIEIRYIQFKHNAIRRGKEFTITYSEFVAFCKRTGYLIRKGRRGYAATIDRIRNNEGYHIDNIHLLTMRSNIDKYHSNDKLKDDANYCPF